MKGEKHARVLSARARRSLTEATTNVLRKAASRGERNNATSFSGRKDLLLCRPACQGQYQQQPTTDERLVLLLRLRRGLHASPTDPGDTRHLSESIFSV